MPDRKETPLSKAGLSLNIGALGQSGRTLVSMLVLLGDERWRREWCKKRLENF
jgi:hypothetical protein